MKKLSRFDLGMIIAFVVVTLLGSGAWYYLSGQLSNTKDDVNTAAGDFEKYTKRQPYLPTQKNEKILQSNLALMQAQLNPVIQTKLQAPGNKLSTVVKEDTVAWKHDLDAEVSNLSTSAKEHNVVVPSNFYYGFSRYLNTNPGDEQTIVLTKQLFGVKEIANILISAPVLSIATFRRTYEEDAIANDSTGSSGSKSDADQLPGAAGTGPGNTYTAYPFEIEFETSTIAFRKLVNDLEKSPYVFVIRSVTVQNSSPNSPQVSELQKLAGTPAGGVLDSSPGTVSTAPKSSRPPQMLFGREVLHVKIRVDMIEWKGMAEEAQPTTPRSRRAGATNGGRG